MLISVNLNFADCVMAGCILLYSFVNLYYDGMFGIVADQWRHSLPCFALESMFLISSQVSLLSAVYMSLHFAVYIPSIVRREASKSIVYLLIVLGWILIGALCIAFRYLKYRNNEDPTNYFCLPFIMSVSSSTSSFILDTLLIVLDYCMVTVCVVSHIYLLTFIIKQRSAAMLKGLSKRHNMLQQVALRMTVLIIGSTVTWMPILLIQTVILLDISLQPHAIFWVVLICFPANLILEPLLIIKQVRKA